MALDTPVTQVRCSSHILQVTEVIRQFILAGLWRLGGCDVVSCGGSREPTASGSFLSGRMRL